MTLLDAFLSGWRDADLVALAVLGWFFFISLWAVGEAVVSYLRWHLSDDWNEEGGIRR